MTQPASTSDAQNPLLDRLDRRFRPAALRRADAGAFPPGFRCGARAATAPRSTRSPPIRRRRLSTTPSWRWKKAAATSTRSPTCSSSRPAPTPATRSRRSSARSRRCSPAIRNAIYLDRTLYARIADLYARRDALGLNAEQARLLDRYHTRFVRAGGALDKPAQDRLATINERLASLGTQFGQNVLADEKSYALMLDEGDLAGLPDFARAAAARRGRGARPARQIRHHAGALVLRELPAILGAAAICARRCSRPGSSAARTAARPTTARSSPRWWRCAASAPSCSAFRPSPTTGSTTRWPRRRPPRASCSTRSGARARAKAQAERDALQDMIAEEGGNFALAA